MTKDKLAVCAEATGDKQALTNRLDRVQVCITRKKNGVKIYFRYFHNYYTVCHIQKHDIKSASI
jgi:hypothetical protein